MNESSRSDVILSDSDEWLNASHSPSESSARWLISWAARVLGVLLRLSDERAYHVVDSCLRAWYRVHLRVWRSPRAGVHMDGGGERCGGRSRPQCHHWRPSVQPDVHGGDVRLGPPLHRLADSRQRPIVYAPRFPRLQFSFIHSFICMPEYTKKENKSVSTRMSRV